MRRRLLFFINPVSGGRSKVELQDKITSKCKSEDADFEIMFTNKDGDYRFLPDKLRKDAVTDVVICGGDGSISPIVASLLDSPVNVGIIPLGSGNGLALTAGIPVNTGKALDIIFKGEGRYVDAFRVNGRLGCQITGMGFDAFIAAEFAREKKRGLSTYTKLAVKHFFKARPYQFTVSSGGKTFHVSAFILCVSNANQFGNNLKIAPKALLSDGLLDIVILKKASKISILLSFLNHLMFARKSDSVSDSDGKPDIFYFNAEAVTVRNTDLAPVHIDGDPLDASENYEIRVLPNAYKLIHPF